MICTLWINNLFYISKCIKKLLLLFHLIYPVKVQFPLYTLSKTVLFPNGYLFFYKYNNG